MIASKGQGSVNIIDGFYDVFIGRYEDGVPIVMVEAPLPPYMLDYYDVWIDTEEYIGFQWIEYEAVTQYEFLEAKTFVGMVTTVAYRRRGSMETPYV